MRLQDNSRLATFSWQESKFEDYRGRYLLIDNHMVHAKDRILASQSTLWVEVQLEAFVSRQNASLTNYIYCYFLICLICGEFNLKLAIIMPEKVCYQIKPA